MALEVSLLTIVITLKLNTFASQCLGFEEKINHFTLKMDQIYQNFFCYNCHTKTHVLNLMHFQEDKVHFFSSKKETLRRESVKYTFKCN